MGVTDFVNSRLVPTLRSGGLTADDIVSGRKVQEIVYLLERSGDNLGFRFKWELFGPFSAELSDEIRGLDRVDVESANEQVQHANGVSDRIEQLMAVPEPLELSDDDWLRLLVCVDFVETRAPGATANGGTPPYIRLNFGEDAIRVAREQTRELLPN